MSEGNSVGSNAVWALALVIIVAIIVGALYFSGMLSRSPVPNTNVEIKIDAPASNSQ
ncbi:MAG: hypothetical protein R2681_13565 [Pyrinomonadaceae bacterium]